MVRITWICPDTGEKMQGQPLHPVVAEEYLARLALTTPDIEHWLEDA